MQPQQPTHPQPAPTKQKMSRGKKALLIIGSLIVLFIIFGMIGSKSDTNNTANTTPASNSQQTQAQPTQPTTEQQITAWQSKNGSIFTTLENDLSNIGTDGKNTDATAMNTDCKHLQTDITTAQSLPAIPDAQSASDWSSGITYLASAAQDCIDGTANYNADQVTKSANEISQANTKIVAAANDIKAAESK